MHRDCGIDLHGNSNFFGHRSIIANLWLETVRLRINFFGLKLNSPSYAVGVKDRSLATNIVQEFCFFCSLLTIKRHYAKMYWFIKFIKVTCNSSYSVFDLIIATVAGASPTCLAKALGTLMVSGGGVLLYVLINSLLEKG